MEIGGNMKDLKIGDMMRPADGGPDRVEITGVSQTHITYRSRLDGWEGRKTRAGFFVRFIEA
jgi:hypothetical protein